MKSSTLRVGAAMACALALTACGGGDGDIAIAGTFYGVTKPGLVLQNNGGSDLTINPTNNGAGQFVFPNLVETDSSYNVTVKSIPTNAKECVPSRNTGKAAFTIDTIQIVCTIRQHELKGTISGLVGNNLVLVNGADKVPVAAGATSFTMAKVNEDAPYAVAILTQPDNQTCTVANGAGTVAQADITNVTVTCGPRT
ncbi:hypothetical protein LK542_20440 [Massilia sp. IC2-477]|uniref:hypothetical protein n=1 Tax=unclassified Massilia TaxID=2609279 RepID=UPI001D124D63|nr:MULTISPECIES: hypothetical protein [unclassified Massilia]MCC2957994.1 hypothetical protein [Massilia sp. IC2-477]MCC2973445.1 hypothetical protein [Massilia sp. IC2-476]